jgi:hypothetical protein
MYLFTRSGRFAPGGFRDAVAFVGAVTEKVNQETGLEVHAWMASMSPELGTCTWGTFVESLEELEAAEDKLAVSEPYVELTEQAAGLFAGPLSDRLASVVHGGRDPSAPVPSYVTVARAVAANGQLSHAIQGGIEIADTATRITGVTTSFLVDATGDYGGCRWVSGHPDIGSVERAEAALLADESWLALIDRIGDRYAPGASQSIYRRLV